MPITALPTPPTRQDPVNFAQRADAFLAALPTFQAEANALETNVNAREVTATTAANTATTAIQAINSALNRFTFSTTVTMGDPGIGFVRFNNAALAAVTAIAIDAQSADTGNPNILNLLVNFGASSSTIKGLIRFTQAGTPSNFAAFNITAVTNNTVWVQLTVALVASSGTFANNANLVMEFHRTGDPGGVTIDTNQTITGVKTFTQSPVVPAINGGQIAGFRNLLINGNFQVNQRAYVSGTAVGAANTYTVDRWRVVVSGQSLVFSASGNGFQITAPAGGVEQVIEGINVGGGTYVLNWTGTATATVNGTSRAKGESLTLTAGSNATVRLIGGTASLVQLEPGGTPTPFEHRPIGAELAMCQRYYEAGASVTVPAGTASHLWFRTTKRAAPTGTIAVLSGGATSVQAITVDGVRPNAASQADITWTAASEL